MSAALEAFVAELRREFPRFRIVDKQGDRLSHWIHRALVVVTLGGQRRYLSDYHTVLGDTLYVPEGWRHTSATGRIIVLRHERVHLRQRRRHTLVGMAFIYLMWPLPLGLAYGRARLEWEAYQETLRATFELCGEAALRAPALRERIVRQFTSGAYGWMWPFPRVVGRWYDAAVEKIAAEGSRVRAGDRSSPA
jgi:hypothetical protein